MEREGGEERKEGRKEIGFHVTLTKLTLTNLTKLILTNLAKLALTKLASTATSHHASSTRETAF